MQHSIRRRKAGAPLALALVLSLLGTGPLLAQAVPQVITLEEAIDMALERNPSVRQAQNAARLSELTVEQQRRQFLPDLSFTTGTGLPYGSPGIQADPNFSAGFSTGIQIGNVYSTMASLEQAKLNETGSEQNLIRSRQTAVFNVMSNYLTLVAAQEQVAVQEENLAAVEAQEAQIAAFVEGDRRTIADLYQAQASTASARLSVLQAERSLILARMNLIRTLQLDPFGEYDFVVPELDPLGTISASLDLGTLSSVAFAQRPDLRASQISLSSAEQGLRIASASRWPSLSLQLGYNSGNFNSAVNGGFFDQLDQGRRGNLSLSVSVPILDFNYGITKERAQISLENARIGLESTRLSVATEVRTAYLDLQLAEEQLTVAEAQMEAAELARTAAEQRYEAGFATLVELTQAQVSHLRAASALVNARYELIFQSRQMDYYLGNLDTGAPVD